MQNLGLGLAWVALLGCTYIDNSGGTETFFTDSFGDGDSTDDGIGGGEAYCDLSCTTNADCGVANASCVEGFCDFPVVEPTECDPANTDPVDPASCGGMPDNCRPIDSFLICVLPCEADADCLVDTLFCTGIDDDGGKYCQPEPFSCTAGSACPGGVGVCNATGDGCTCSSDADCTANDLACHMIG